MWQSARKRRETSSSDRATPSYRRFCTCAIVHSYFDTRVQQYTGFWPVFFIIRIFICIVYNTCIISAPSKLTERTVSAETPPLALGKQLRKLCSQVRGAPQRFGRPHLRTDDGGVGVKARRSGVALRRPGAHSSKYCTWLLRRRCCACLRLRPSLCVAVRVRRAVIGALAVSLLLTCCALDCLYCAQFFRHLVHFLARRQRPSQTGAFAFFFERTCCVTCM